MTLYCVCIFFAESIISENDKLVSLYKELVEINLSLTTYVQESKKRLSELRLDLARNAKGSHRVVELLSDKC